MQAYDFNLVIDSVTDITSEVEDAIFEAGCDDAIVSKRNEIIYLDFDREADSLEAAILSAIAQVEQTKCGLIVKRVEPSDLVTGAEIARRLQRSRQSVRQLISGERGNGDFPLPIAGVTTKTMLWSWVEIVTWFLKKGKLEDTSIYNRAITFKQINDSLDFRRSQSTLAAINRITKLLSRTVSEV